MTQTCDFYLEKRQTKHWCQLSCPRKPSFSHNTWKTFSTSMYLLVKKNSRHFMQIHSITSIHSGCDKLFNKFSNHTGEGRGRGRARDARVCLVVSHHSHHQWSFNLWRVLQRDYGNAGSWLEWGTGLPTEWPQFPDVVWIHLYVTGTHTRFAGHLGLCCANTLSPSSHSHALKFRKESSVRLVSITHFQHTVLYYIQLGKWLQILAINYKIDIWIF